MATNTWIGATGNLSSTWNTGTHWSLGRVPSSADTALVNAAGTRAYTVTEDVTSTVAGLTISSVNASLSILGVTLTVSGATRLSTGSISFASASGQLNTATFTQTGGTFSGNRGKFTVTGAGAALSVSGGAFNEAAAATITVSNAASFSGGRTSIGGTFTAGQILLGGSSTTVSVSATGRLITNVDDPTANVIDTGDTLRMTTGSVVDFTGAGASTGAGVLDNGTILGSGTLSGVVSGAGVVEASGGKLELTGDIADPSTVFNIDGGTSTLQLDAGVGNGNSFNFNDPTSGGIVYNSTVTGISLAITGMNVGAGATTPTNFLDFSQYTVSVVGDSAFSGDTATISLSDGSTLTLDQVADASATWYVDTISDGAGGTALFPSDTPVCYAAGTHILTPEGERLVETLQQGDIVLIRQNDQLVPQQLTWVGSRKVNIAAHPRPRGVAPIRFQAHSIGDNIPPADLIVSSDHGMLIDGRLICARQLVNGTTIRQELNCASIRYYHLEVEGHAILLAEGMTAESYLDTGNRAFFGAPGAPVALHPELPGEADTPMREWGSCAPFVWDEASVRPVWSRLADRARVLGQPVPEPDTTRDSALHVIVNGRRLQPLRNRNGQYTFVLPPGAAELRLVSRAAAPTDVRPWVEDRRCLGVYVEQIVLRNLAGEIREIPLDHPGMESGWWAVERDGGVMRRWTNGDARLPLPAFDDAGPIALEIRASVAEISCVVAPDREQVRAAA